MKASMRKTIRAENGWQWLWGLVKECISIFTHSRCKLFHLNFLNTILCFDLILMGLQIRKHKHGLERQIASLCNPFMHCLIHERKRENWKEKKEHDLHLERINFMLNWDYIKMMKNIHIKHECEFNTVACII